MTETEQEEPKTLWDHLLQKHDGYLYRYEEVRYSLGVDEWDDPIPGCSVQLELREFPVFKQTAKGVWILISKFTHLKRFVLFESRKKFACLTKEEALISFKARKRSQIKILEEQLEGARKALRLAESTNVDVDPFEIRPEIWSD